MPDVDQGKYNTKDKLRELIRRERSVELAGEGLRRADILRWKDENGKMVAEKVLNGELKRMAGTGRGGHADVRGDDLASSIAPFYPAAIVRRIDWRNNADDCGY